MHRDLPRFLASNLEKKNFHGGGDLRIGGLTSASAIGFNLESSQDVPDGYVVKEYNFPTGAWNRAESLRPIFGVNDVDSLENLQKMNKVLQNRQAEAERYFSPLLPNFVEPKQIIIGKNTQGKLCLFELQKEMKGVPLSRYLSSLLEHLDMEQIRCLEGEVIALIDLLKNMDQDSYYSQNILDLGLGNIFLTEDGHLKLVDTNIEASVQSPEQFLFVEEMKKRRKLLLETLRNLHIKLIDIKNLSSLLLSIE